MTSWDEPPDAIAPWNMPGFDKDEPFYRDDVLPQTLANTPQVATRLNDEQLVISTVLDQPHAWDAIRHLRPSDFDMKPLADAWTAISQAIRSRTPVTPQALNAIDATLKIEDLTRLAARSPRSIAACHTAAPRMTGLKRARLAAETLRNVARDN